MVETGVERPGALIPGLDGPALIAHGGGNTQALARSAVADLVDFVEVDLWVHRGRFEARHERAAYPLPFLFEKWYLRRIPRKPCGLAELLRETAGRTRIFLDLKNGGDTAAKLVRRSIDEAGPGIRMAASSQDWRMLRAVGQRCPEVDLFYSIDVLPKLDLFLSVIQRDQQPRGVSCKHTLLTEPLIEDLHERGLSVVAWTVDDLDRARELTAWGVDGITTHHAALFRQAVLSSPAE
jgi:glycerophosphoryl diester phosphodiesterase